MTARRTWLIVCVPFVLAANPVSAAPPEPGALVLAGGRDEPAKAREEFFRLAGGKEKARIVVVPTARADAGKGKEDELLKPWKDLDPLSVELFHTRDRAKANDESFTKPLAEATGVWFLSGHADRLADAYQGTRFEAELKKVLDRGGVVGGSGRGANVLSDKVVWRWDPDADVRAGYGLLPGFLIDNHFGSGDDSAAANAALEKHPGYAALRIDDDAALVVRGRSVRVIGEGKVTVCWAKSPIKPAREDVLKAGERLDLFQVRRAAAFRALTPPFPPKDPPAPVVAKGALVIVGGGGTTSDIMDRFFELAGGANALVVVIPTANDDGPVAADPGDAKYLRKWGGTNVKVLHTRDPKEANDPAFSKVLLEAKGVWFGGGRQWRFVDAYEGTLTEKRIRGVLDRGGVIGGSSAGASIQSEYMPRGHPLGNAVMAAEGYERGFGYLPGCAVDQHFFARKRTADMTGLMKLYPQLLGIGIDESTAIVVTGHVAEVLGKSRAAFYDYRDGAPAGEKDYVEVKAGENYDLKARKLMK